MCRNFTYEVVEQRRRLKAVKKNVAQKINVILFFDRFFFKYFFRVLHEASSSWLKFLHNFQKHPVYSLTSSITPLVSISVHIFIFALLYILYFSVVYLMNVVLEAENSQIYGRNHLDCLNIVCINSYYCSMSRNHPKILQHILKTHQKQISNCCTKKSCCISGTGFGICLDVSPAGLSELALVLNRLKPLKS
jgi:hypothetical protein